MASYDYSCENDAQTQVVVRGMTEDEVLPICSICNTPMKRVYTAPPVKFNATGFYSTGG